MKKFIDKFNPLTKEVLFYCLIAFCFALSETGIMPTIGVIIIILKFNSSKKKINEGEKNLKAYDEKISQASRVSEVINLRNEQLEYEYEQKKLNLHHTHVQDVMRLQKEKEKIYNEINNLETETLLQAFDFSEFNISSQECKDKISLLKIQEKSLQEKNLAFLVNTSLDKKVSTNNLKQIIRCFNAECDNVFYNLSVKNIDSQRQKIVKSFESLNKIFETDGITISQALLSLKLEELSLTYAYELKKEQEKEIQREIRATMLEEEKVRKEIEIQKAKIEKEEAQFKNEISKLTLYLDKSSDDVQKQVYLDKIAELESKLKLLEKDKQNVLEREQNTRAGYVYIISNIGSFGENVYKIGMTRRLEPMDRVKELGDASVPFQFDVHALIFSEDAPALETLLHQTFRQFEVNKVNPRKEFFKVDIQQIIDIVKDKYNPTTTFTIVPDASEYRQSI